MIPMQNNLAQRVAGVGQPPVMGTQGTAMLPQNNLARPMFGVPAQPIQAQPIQPQPMQPQMQAQPQMQPQPQAQPMQNNLRARLGMMA